MKIKNYFIIGFLMIIHTLAVAGTNEGVFFTGTDIRTVTANKGRPEYPEIALNVSETYKTDNEISYLYDDISDFLSSQPGFFVEKKEYGSQLYLRGISSGALFLYDGVPLTNDLTKNFSLIDGEIPLTHLSSLEVVRGASSSLWGPDAFAGVVNMRPKRGRDIEGLQFGASKSLSDIERNIFANFGHNMGDVEYFISAANKVFNISGDDNSNEYSFTGNINVKNIFYLSALHTYSGRKFVYVHPENGYNWPSSSTKNLSLVKSELSVKNNDYYLGLKGYYYRLNFDANEMSRKWEQDDSVFNLELRGDKSLFNSNGLISIGASYKENHILDSTISSRGYPPDFIGDDNFFKPFTEKLTTTTFTNTFYMQYQHHFNKIDLLIGGRKDKHSVYGDYINYNGSVLYKPFVGYELKLTYGTAYRTPYAAFLNEKDDPKPEKVTSYNLEFKKEFGNKAYIKFIPFYNEVKDFLMQDPYGGMSDYTDFTGAGLESSIFLPLGKKFDLTANVTYQQIWSEDENYNVLQYIIIWPDGTVKKVYKDFDKIYHEGANIFGNMNAHWHFNKYFDFDFLIKYIGERKYQILPKEHTQKMSGYFTADFGLRSKNLIKNLYVDFVVKDLFQSEKSNLGELNYIDAEGRRFLLKANYKF